MYKILTKNNTGYWEFVKEDNSLRSESEFKSYDEVLKIIDNLLDFYNRSEIRVIEEHPFDIKAFKREENKYFKQ